jgi:hypothetical protein
LVSPYTTVGVGNSGTLSVNTSLWMAVGQVIIISDGSTNWVHARVTATPTTSSVTVTELGYSGDASIGTVLIAGSKASPAGIGLKGGSSTLVAGTKSIAVPGGFGAGAVILATFSDPDAGTVGVLSIPIATRISPNFVVNSVKADGTTPLTTDTGSFDWAVIG